MKKDKDLGPLARGFRVLLTLRKEWSMDSIISVFDEMTSKTICSSIHCIYTCCVYYSYSFWLVFGTSGDASNAGWYRRYTGYSR